MQQHVAIANALANTSVTFAQVNYTSPIALAAAHKNNVATKTVSANVTLFNNIKNANVYANALAKNANACANTIAQNMQSTHYAHTNCFSIVYNAKLNTYYLYCIYNAVRSVNYALNNTSATKTQIAQLCTKSAARKMLNTNNAQYSATHNITHTLQLRTIKCTNINSITLNNTTLNFA